MACIYFYGTVTRKRTDVSTRIFLRTSNSSCLMLSSEMFSLCKLRLMFRLIFYIFDISWTRNFSFISCSLHWIHYQFMMITTSFQINIFVPSYLCFNVEQMGLQVSTQSDCPSCQGFNFLPSFPRHSALVYNNSLWVNFFYTMYVCMYVFIHFHNNANFRGN